VLLSWSNDALPVVVWGRVEWEGGGQRADEDENAPLRDKRENQGGGGLAGELATYPRRTSPCTLALRPRRLSSSSSPFMPTAAGRMAVFEKEGSKGRREARAGRAAGMREG